MARSELSGIGMMSIPAQKDTAARDGKDVSYTPFFAGAQICSLI